MAFNNCQNICTMTCTYQSMTQLSVTQPLYEEMQHYILELLWTRANFLSMVSFVKNIFLINIRNKMAEKRVMDMTIVIITCLFGIVAWYNISLSFFFEFFCACINWFYNNLSLIIVITTSKLTKISKSYK